MGRKLLEQNFIQFNNIEEVTNYIAYPTKNSHVAEFKIDFDFKYHTLEKKLLIARKQVTINKLYKIGQESDFSDYNKCAVLSPKHGVLEMELENNQYLYLISEQCYSFCCNLPCKEKNNCQLLIHSRNKQLNNHLVKSEPLLKEEQDCLNNANKRKRESSNSNKCKEAKIM
ncbi:hypothetical protein ABK040_001521 [Willaertia magna]